MKESVFLSMSVVVLLEEYLFGGVVWDNDKGQYVKGRVFLPERKRFVIPPEEEELTKHQRLLSTFAYAVGRIMLQLEGASGLAVYGSAVFLSQTRFISCAHLAKVYAEQIGAGKQQQMETVELLLKGTHKFSTHPEATSKLGRGMGGGKKWAIF